MSELFINNQRLVVRDTDIIGHGNEAIVITIGGGRAAKIYKGPDHPDFQGLPNEQEGARHRLREHQTKLGNFPTRIDSSIVLPIDMVRHQDGEIRGYTMRFIANSNILMRYTEPQFRAGVPFNTVKNVLLNLHDAVSGVHKSQIVIGDFNDRNVLVTTGGKVWLIDADSMQYGNYFCLLYTVKFVDPLLCKPDELTLVKPHNQLSDWYAFGNMAYELLTFGAIYGGRHKPSNRSQTVKASQRVFRRIPAWDDDVHLPSFVRTHKVLPDDLMEFFDQMIRQDKRDIIPRYLIEDLEERVCDQTGEIHYRHLSPFVAHTPQAAVTHKVTISGQVKATRIFHTSGNILFAVSEEGSLKYLYHQGGKYYREGDQVIGQDPLDPNNRYRISGKNTLIASGNRVVVHSQSQPPKVVTTDVFGTNLPVLAANSRSFFWTNGDLLYRNLDELFGLLDREVVGSIISQQTLIWAGEHFGFGFYRLGGNTQAFIFDTARPNSVRMLDQAPQIKGELLDVSCVFLRDQCWFTTTTQEGADTVNRCYVISNQAQALAAHTSHPQDEDWLSDSIRGFAPFKDRIFIPTHDGMVSARLENSVFQVATFPDTRKYVDPGTHLFIGVNGIYAVNQHQIYLLEMR